MPQISRRFHRLGLAAAIAAIATLAGPPAAHAGYYTVSGTCGLWSPYTADGTRVAAYPACPAMVARNAWGAFTTAPGVGAGWRFDSPAGTAIASVELHGLAYGLNGWQSAIYAEGGSSAVLVNCPGVTCPGASISIGGSYPVFNASAIVTRVRCGSSNGCSNNADSSMISISGAAVTLFDPSPPGLALSGGTLLSGGWKSGTQTLVVDASDNSGIYEASGSIDGSRVSAATRACDYGQRVPCSNGGTALSIPTGGLSDGAHQVAGGAVDAAGNSGSSGPTTVYTDNSAPTQPIGAAVAQGSGFHSNNSFDVSWRNPPQNFAPIAGAGYRLCPSVPADASLDVKAKAQAKCIQGSKSGINLSQIKDLKLPGSGLYDLKLWLVDAAGNQQPASAAEINGVGFDDSPPSDVAFQAPEPTDPARVNVTASDSVSGVASGAIEVRRDGEAAWQALSTQVTSSGLTAVIDDELLPKGMYFLRARVVDGAGLEASNDRTAAGLPATVKLPIRLASRLVAGRRGHRRCRGHGTRRHCRYRLATKPRLSVGRAARLYGRLTVAGKAMPDMPLEVWRRLALDGAQWARIGTVTTSRTGRFSYKARRGPARTIRLRYPGTPMIRGHNSDVVLRVRAATTFRPSRRNVTNGEYVTFRGHLKGGWIPAGGALVELQVRTRGQWRTFAQPRAAAGTGRWSYRYRFETVRGRAAFRFRARIRRQPGFPFTTGASRPTRVRVRGL